MKPIPPLIIQRRLARYEYRPLRHHANPAADCLFRPQADPDVRPIQAPSDKDARRDFRKMSAQMLAGSRRPGTLEIVVFALIVAVGAWPLLSLLMLLAETVPGWGR